MNNFENYLTKDWNNEDSHTMDFYIKNGGYKTLEKIFKMTPDEIIDTVKLSGLRGRGGAGFPTGVKWGFVPKDNKKPRYLAINADESEPGTFKDKYIIRNSPHLLIEGIIIASYAINAHNAYLYIRGEFFDEYNILKKAIEEAKNKKYLGEKILNKDFNLEIILVRGAGAYICGEETALLSSVEGKRGNPKLRPPFPAVEGLWESPTVINNVETLANLPFIIERGVDWFKGFGTEKSSGNKLYCVSGHVNNTGVFEMPLGTPLDVIINEKGKGVWKNKKLKAVSPGGLSAPILTEKQCNVKMDFDSLAEIGSMLGSAGITVMDEDTNMVNVCRNIIKFFHHESCGQCTPCREGMGWLDKLIAKIQKGNGVKSDIDKIESICKSMMGRTICALADAGAMPIKSIVSQFRNEFDDKIKNEDNTKNKNSIKSGAE